MKILTLAHLKACRNSDIAVFLGCGPSINEVTENGWSNIIKHDVWAINNWVYHPTIVPNFYHIEVKHYDFDIMRKRLEQKKEKYKDVNFILPKQSSFQICPRGSKIYTYKTKSRDPKRTHRPFNAKYKPIGGSVLTKSYDMSITALFELLYRFRYSLIILIGIDLYDSRYFWTGGNPKYGEVHHQWNKEHEGKDINLPHNTYRIKDYIVDFNKRWMIPKERKICVGHKETMLYPELDYISPEDL